MTASADMGEEAIAPPSTPFPKANSIDRVHYSDLSPTEFGDRYRTSGTPLIVQGLLDEEPEWNLAYLRQALGHQVFPVRHYGQARYQQDKRDWTSFGSGVEALSMTFNDYANHLMSGAAKQKDLYLARCSLKNTPLEQGHTLCQAEAWFGLRFPATALNLWVGTGGHTSCLHYDPMDGLLMQLYGAKKVLLFPPSQTYNLYPVPVYEQLRHGLKLRSAYSKVYPYRPDLQAFPRYAHAMPHGAELVLHPGDILFLPAGWCHEVTSLGDDVVCSVNRFWNVFPLSRAVCSWNKWRAHLGSVLASPHMVKQWISAIRHAHSGEELKKLWQQL
ncbi:MAG: cupin-like domain-containing protein [Leptolyngbyaceae bacterium]|nr:cupin-like domain-containing protein [Leptolyngbyaceae bacterium]